MPFVPLCYYPTVERGRGIPENLPEAWQEAFRRDAGSEKPSLADPLPERRLARLLAGFVGVGLIFMLLPGTLLGVWNLLGISSRREAAGVSAIWVQAHGHAQLFGWVVTFLIGISLYAVPKFRGSLPRSIPLGWVMLGAWTVAVAMRWVTGFWAWRWHGAWPWSAALELAVAGLLVWECTARGPSHKRGEAWERPVFAGFGGLVLTLAWQLYLVVQPLPEPALPAFHNGVLLWMSLWVVCFPIVLGFSARFFPGLLGTQPAGRSALSAGLLLLGPAAVGYAAGQPVLAAAASLGAVLLGCWGLRVFHPRRGASKTSGVDRRFPYFARGAYVWLVIAVLLSFQSGRPGMLGASRHAFTVGFLATMIFSIGPRILPSFLGSRELWSPALMLASLVLLTTGCALRVSCEPLAYGGVLALAWRALPVSALIELSAVALFGLNLGVTLARPVPTWFGRRHVNGRMSLYWLVTSYPATRRLLIEQGLVTLSRSQLVPKSLTLQEAAEADRVPVERLVQKLGDFFDSRLARLARAGGGSEGG